MWTIKLRKDVRFHDGKPLTAADVVYSFTRHKDPAVGSKARSLADQMAEVKATGPNEVQITLAGPNADLPVVFGISHFLIIRDGTTDFATANGTGPVQVQGIPAGHSYRGCAQHRELQARHGRIWTRSNISAFTDEEARINALLSGDVQLAGGINPRLGQADPDRAGLRAVRDQGAATTPTWCAARLAAGGQSRFRAWR